MMRRFHADCSEKFHVGGRREEWEFEPCLVFVKNY